MKESKKLSPADLLKLRILKVKRHMPDKYMKAIIESHPELDTVASRFHIGNVIGLKCSDEEITKLVEKLFLPKKTKREAV